jgi:hypothetical protein
VRIISILRHAALTLFGVLVLVMAYGLYWFPAAPLRYQNGQYVDKRGGVHARSEFERVRIWERVLIGSWIASAGSAAAYELVKRRGKSK